MSVQDLPRHRELSGRPDKLIRTHVTNFHWWFKYPPLTSVPKTVMYLTELARNYPTVFFNTHTKCTYHHKTTLSHQPDPWKTSWHHPSRMSPAANALHSLSSATRYSKTKDRIHWTNSQKPRRGSRASMIWRSALVSNFAGQRFFRIPPVEPTKIKPFSYTLFTLYFLLRTEMRASATLTDSTHAFNQEYNIAHWNVRSTVPFGTLKWNAICTLLLFVVSFFCSL